MGFRADLFDSVCVLFPINYSVGVVLLSKVVVLAATEKQVWVFVQSF